MGTDFNPTGDIRGGAIFGGCQGVGTWRRGKRGREKRGDYICKSF